MGGNSFVGYLNSGCDIETNSFIDRTYFRLTTLSGIYPILDDGRPWHLVRDLALLLFNTAMIFFTWFVTFSSASALRRINFSLLMNDLHVMILLQMGMAVLWHSWLTRSNTAKLHRIIAGDFFDYQEDLSDTLKTLKNSMRKDRWRCVQCVILIGFAVIIVVIFQRFLNQLGTFEYDATVHNVNFDQPIPSAYPFNATGSVEFFSIQIMEVVGSSVLCLVLSTKCLMFIETVLHIQMQQKLLIIQFAKIQTRAQRLCSILHGPRVSRGKSKLYTDNECYRCFDICLRKNILHHQHIIKAQGELNRVFGFYAFNFYVTSVTTIAMSVLATSSMKEFPGTTVAAVIMCLVETLFVALYSHLGQKLTDLAVDLREEIYNVKWYQCNNEVKKIINILLTVTSTNTSFSYHNILHINHDSFAKAMNSAYSYYSLVKASE